MTKTRAILALIGLSLLTLGVRFLHLLNPDDHYFIVNPDSFWFHHEAVKIWEGGYAPEIHKSGLTYILAFSPDFLTVILPPILGLFTALIIYYAVKRMYDTRAALASVLIFAVAAPAYYLTLSGNVDRDCLSLFLITAGLFLYHFSKTWVGGLGVALIMAVLFLLWGFIGPAIMIGVMVVGFLVQWSQHNFDKGKLQVLAVFGVLIFLVLPFSVPYLRTQLGDAFTAFSSSPASELNPISLLDLYPYLFICFPLLFGIQHMLQRRFPNDLFLLSWAGASILFGLVAMRLSIYMVSAVCAIAGVGLVYLWDNLTLAKEGKQIMLAFTGIFLVISGAFAFNLPDSITMSNDWEDALTWVREETPQDAVMAAWWDYGHWILDVGDRESAANNGYHTEDTDRIIGQIMQAEDDAEAVRLMGEIRRANGEYGTDYLIMSTREERIWPIIVEASEEADKDGSLYKRVFSGEVLKSPYWHICFWNDSVIILQPIPS